MDMRESIVIQIFNDAMKPFLFVLNSYTTAGEV